MANSRAFKINGKEYTISSREPKVGSFHLALTQILMEMAVERRTDKLEFSVQEIALRLITKGYDPETGKKIDQSKDSEPGQ